MSVLSEFNQSASCRRFQGCRSSSCRVGTLLSPDSGSTGTGLGVGTHAKVQTGTPAAENCFMFRNQRRQEVNYRQIYCRNVGTRGDYMELVAVFVET